jgi:hypothetical protein
MGAGGWDQARASGTGRGLVGTSANSRRGRVGPGMDSSRDRGCGRTRVGRGLFARPRMRAHTRRARTGRKGRGLQARTRGTGRRLFARPRLWAHTRRAQTQVNGRKRVGPGANTMSLRGRKAIRAQPLRWGQVSGRGRVRERARARTGACCRGGGCTRELKGRTRLWGRGV